MVRGFTAAEVENQVTSIALCYVVYIYLFICFHNHDCTMLSISYNQACRGFVVGVT